MVDLSVASHKSGHIHSLYWGRLEHVGNNHHQSPLNIPVKISDRSVVYLLKNSNMDFDNMSRSLGSILLEDRTREREAESSKDALLTKSENSCSVLQT